MASLSYGHHIVAASLARSPEGAGRTQTLTNKQDLGLVSHGRLWRLSPQNRLRRVAETFQKQKDVNDSKGVPEARGGLKNS